MTAFSYQLYSSRNFPPLGDTLGMLAEVGYAEVEGYGALVTDDTDLGALRASLDAVGLSMPTAHVDVETLRTRPERAIEIAKALGLEAVFGPYLAEDRRPTTAAGWGDFGTMLGEAAKPLQDAGLVVGWHNHAFEFEPVEGHLPMDLVLEASDTLTVEFDVAWCVKGGTDPLAWMAAHGDRIAAGHIKDIAPEGACLDEDGWADVGEGVMDWPACMVALRKTPCRWFIAEHDNPSNHRRFATRSLAAMRGF
ncbi:MAG: sugar phosphate isomerase/epimerase family protein [Paracoccaceae bacterium]